MRPVSSVLTATISAPSDRVFAILTDVAKIPQWLPGCRSVDASGPVRKGARLRVNFLSGRATELEIVDFTPATSLGWSDREGRRGSQLFFQLKFGGSATQLVMKEVWTPKSVGDWIRGRLLKRRNVKKMFGTAVNNLRKLAVP
ncbi:MAG TPA: SRPBCC family protein [Gemmatimonadales bacterium]